MKLCAAYKVFNAATYIAYSLKSIYDHVDRIVILLSTRPWSGIDQPPDATAEIIRAFPDPDNKLQLIAKDWGIFPKPINQLANELMTMNFLLDYIRSECRGVTHYFYVDADEVFHRNHMVYLRDALATFAPDCEVRGAWRCYWKSFSYWIDPPEPSRPLVAFPVKPHVRYTTQRDTNLPSRMILAPSQFLIHHFSYALPSEAVWQSKCHGPHGQQFIPGWFQNVWLKWDEDRKMRHLHPCWPSHFKRAVRADPRALPDVMREHPFYGKDII